MVRYITAVAIACVYMATSVWVVRSAGEAYRNGLVNAPLVTTKTEKSIANPPEKEAQTAAVLADLNGSDASSEPTVPARAPAPVPERPRAKGAAAGRSKAKTPSSSEPKVELAKAKPVTHPAAPPPAPAPAPAQPALMLDAKANPLDHNPFWNQESLKKNWDISAIKPEEENRIGAEFHDLMVQLNLLVKEGPWLTRVEDVAEPLLKNLRRKEIRYQFFILDSDAVNAFSTPGGYIYVSRGLFDMIAEDEDYALQFAVGHEIAHVDLQHAFQCLRDPDVRKMSQGTLQKLYWLIIPYGYLESAKVTQEFEADEWVCNRMQALHRTRREILIFLQKLDGYAKANGFGEGHGKPEPGRDLTPLENHYRSLTAARKRLKHLKEFIEQAANGSK